MFVLVIIWIKTVQFLNSNWSNDFLEDRKNKSFWNCLSALNSCVLTMSMYLNILLFNGQVFSYRFVWFSVCGHFVQMSTDFMPKMLLSVNVFVCVTSLIGLWYIRTWRYCPHTYLALTSKQKPFEPLLMHTHHPFRSHTHFSYTNSIGQFTKNGSFHFVLSLSFSKFSLWICRTEKSWPLCI